MAAVLIATNGPAARGLCRCSARATSSLPVPDSPVISTVADDCESRPIARNTSCIAGAWPSISGESAVATTAAGECRDSVAARRISASAWSTSNGFGRYSNAPPWNAATALSRSEYAVMMMIGICGCRSFTSASSCRPDSPGIRMSETSTCGSLTCERLQHFVRGGERLVRNALARERLLEHPADRAIVVDDPDDVAAFAARSREWSLASAALIGAPRSPRGRTPSAAVW